MFTIIDFIDSDCWNGMLFDDTSMTFVLISINYSGIENQNVLFWDCSETVLRYKLDFHINSSDQND